MVAKLSCLTLATFVAVDLFGNMDGHQILESY